MKRIIFSKIKFYEKYGFQKTENPIIKIPISFDINNLKFRTREIKKIISNDAMSFIDDQWRINKEKNPDITNGLLFDTENIINAENDLIFDGNFAEFKLYLGTANPGYESFFKSGNYISNHTSCASLIFSKDNKIIIGYKIKTGRFALIGGMMSSDDLNFKNPAEKCLMRELIEEIGEIKVMSRKFIGIFANTKTNHINLLYHLHSDMTFNEILELHKYNLINGIIEDEINELISIENKDNQIKNFIESNLKTLTEIRREALLNLINDRSK